MCEWKYTVDTVFPFYGRLFSTPGNSDSRYSLEPFSISLEGSSYRESDCRKKMKHIIKSFSFLRLSV